MSNHTETPAFNPADWTDAPEWVYLDSHGTGHHYDCPATSHDRPVAFVDGGFDLFCPDGCLDHTMPQARTILPHATTRGDSIDNPYEGKTGGPGAKATDPHADLSDDEVHAYIAAIPRKLTDDDMTPRLVKFASTWLADYTGDFEFLVDMKAKTRLSTGMARGVLNCAKRETPKKDTRSDRQERNETTLDLSDLPSGRYAVPGGSRLKVQIDNVDKPGTKWDGYIFVKDAAEYGHGQRYGMQKPGQDYRGDITEELATILADPISAMAAYGHLVGKCGKCGRHLEDEESIERGIGPICWGKMGGM